MASTAIPTTSALPDYGDARLYVPGDEVPLVLDERLVTMIHVDALLP